MNFIVAIGLLFLEPEDAFWLLVAVTEKILPKNYFDCGLVGAQADQECLKEIVQKKFPDLYEHLTEYNIDLSAITLNWFLVFFIDAVPFEVFALASNSIIKIKTFIYF